MAKHSSNQQSTSQDYSPRHASGGQGTGKGNTKRNGKSISFDVLMASMARDYRNI